MPRLLTITAYLVGALLLVDFGRLVVLLGLRGLGHRRSVK